MATITTGDSTVSTAAIQTLGNLSLVSILAALTNGNQLSKFPSYSTYSATATIAPLATTPTDIFNMTGSASKIVFITRVEISGTTTSGSGISANILLTKKSALNTGASNPITPLPHSSAYSASGVTAKYYTTNPSALGAAVGAARAARYSFATNGTQVQPLIWEFDPTNPSKQLILVNATENISINLGGTTITGSVVAINVEYIEV